MDVYCLIYQLTYHFVYDNDEQLCDYINVIVQQFKGYNSKMVCCYLFTNFYVKSTNYANDTLFDEFQSSLNELTQQVSYQTNIKTSTSKDI